MDKDGDIDLEGVRMVLKAALNVVQLDAEQRKTADVNGNDSVELDDAWMVLKAALGVS